MSGKLHQHIRQNVVGYIALFLVISGGTAYATHPGGQNTISSADIIDDQIRTEDIRTNAVKQDDIGGNAVISRHIKGGAVQSSDVRDDTVNNGGLNAQDLNPDSVGSSELAPDSVGTADVIDNSLTGNDIADTSSLGTAEINEDDLFNDDSLNAADVANNSPLGTAEINEGNLNVVEGPSNMQMLFGREQLSGGESGPAAVIFANGRANVNAEKNSSNHCSLSFLNSPFAGVTLTFLREVVNGSAVTLTSGTLGQGVTDSTAFFSTPIQVRWQAWAAGNPSTTGRVITVDASARPSGTTCDFSAVMTVGA